MGIRLRIRILQNTNHEYIISMISVLEESGAGRRRAYNKVGKEACRKKSSTQAGARKGDLNAKRARTQTQRHTGDLVCLSFLKRVLVRMHACMHACMHVRLMCRPLRLAGVCECGRGPAPEKVYCPRTGHGTR